MHLFCFFRTHRVGSVRSSVVQDFFFFFSVCFSQKLKPWFTFTAHSRHVEAFGEVWLWQLLLMQIEKFGRGQGNGNVGPEFTQK